MPETSDEQKPKKKDFSATLNLPKTDFPMKGDLPAREPAVEAAWAAEGLYARMAERQKGRAETFVLHDGPPYANGHIHIGHALNKTLKDMVVKSRSLMGARAPYIPGWDCHGLPIETALLKEMKMGQDGISDRVAFRREAAKFAERFIDIQRAEFRRLGGVGDWENPYKTLSRGYESRVIRAFRLLMQKGYIYRGVKPVYWCVTCKTALAEAEVEYKEKASPSVYVALPVRHPKSDFWKGQEDVEVVVWTTTPWTLPANVAVAFHPELDYVLVEARSPAWVKSRRLLLAEPRREAVLKAVGAVLERELGRWKGRDLAPENSRDKSLKFSYSKPFKTGKDDSGEGIGVLASYVTAEDGTGVVHTAPGHGADDFETGRKFGLPAPCPVDAAGRFTSDSFDFQGKHVFKEGNPAVVAELKARGWLLAEEEIRHSYPHCWRCKHPIVFRATEQWFLNVTHDGLREKLLKAIGEVRWIPAAGAARISSMVQNRPDWCLSRQRVWGTPIPILFCERCPGVYLSDDTALKAIEDKVAHDGSDFWFESWGEPVTRAEWDFLPAETRCPKCNGASFRRETDILDVWVDSGASWLSVLADAGQVPCDLYLEGSDQHRGWFQSSLVLSVALNGRAPYKTVLTHGFVLDENGRAMHKSAGNVVSPQEVTGTLGADVLRLWVALSDYSDDVRISDKLLEGPTDAYRRVRNTLRYLLGNTCDFDPAADAVAFEEMREMEKYMLHRLAEVQTQALAHYREFQFRAAARLLTDYCAFDLSAFYLDALKDRLYTFAPKDPERRAAQTVLAEIFRRLTMLLSPILSFTAEEAWKSWLKGPGRGGEAASVFLSELAEPEFFWTDPDLGTRWGRILSVREKVLKALEEARAAKKIGSSLGAKVVLRGGGEFFDDIRINWAEVFLASSVDIGDWMGELRVEILPAEGLKCARCWRHQIDVGFKPATPDVCVRCAEVLAGLRADASRPSAS